MDVALGIEALVPAAEYFGSTTDNLQESYDRLNWFDKRSKPTWQQIKTAYDKLPDEIKNPV